MQEEVLLSTTFSVLLDGNGKFCGLHKYKLPQSATPRNPAQPRATPRNPAHARARDCATRATAQRTRVRNARDCTTHATAQRTRLRNHATMPTHACTYTELYIRGASFADEIVFWGGVSGLGVRRYPTSTTRRQ